MKSSHLTVMVLCHVLLASVVFYFTSGALASPLTHQAHQAQQQQQPIEAKPQQPIAHPPAVAVAVAAAAAPHESQPQPRSGAPAPQVAAAFAVPQKVEVAQVVAPKEPAVEQAAKAAEQPIRLTERTSEAQPKPAPVPVAPVPVVVQKEEAQAKSAPIVEQAPVKPEPAKPVEAAQEVRPKSEQQHPIAPAPIVPQPAALMAAPVVVKEEVATSVSKVVPVASAPVEQPSAVVAQLQPQQQAAPAQSAEQKAPSASAPVVMGGLGPLHLLATTLCSYQPDKPSADEHLNQLYARRASVRKSLFEFMSLKFTNLEKLSSRLGYGLQVVPVKSQPDSSKVPGVTPSHGWPVVGKCTAYDLKLMGEAAWCECQEGDFGCPRKPTGDEKPAVAAAAQVAAPAPAPVPVPAQAQVAQGEEQPARIASNQHMMAAAAAAAAAKTARSIGSTNSFLPSPEESSVISKLLHVGDIKDAPTVESTIYNLNLTQHQLATLEAHATSTQECRRNALRYSKALFNHLAEDQRQPSESWPRLYELISSDDCARKRMIDIFNALSGFRTDTTSIRRDNLEFAFAMDDLRVKVLESETNVPLTFDRHFIEVEQFLQQSVRLMLANIQPKRAKLTSMRYRSLMYGASQQAADDQCIDLHQRLLSRSYPNDCNPTQFGQLPDSLRMTASSLELWSIEKELSLHTAKVSDYPNTSAVGQQKVKENVNECIANLVAS